MTISEWSLKRIAEWTKHESFHSHMGVVSKLPTGEWGAKVAVERNGKVVYARLTEEYVSADVAMKAVERTWKRERGEK